MLTVEQTLSRYANDLSHPNEVRRLCMMIFDELNERVKELPGCYRNYLEAGALLHDIGYYVDAQKHNEHAQALIVENGLNGFSKNDTEIIACICRYHRGKLPDKEKHKIYKTLSKGDRKIVKKLSGILRIADGLDRAHLGLIKKVKLNFDKENNIIEFLLTSNTPGFKPDISYAIKKRELFEKAFKCQCVFKFK